ncbi:MAG: hypothetical protein JWM11_5301, partial [Planctomycetaceae bacterium]|nr:hypothetical protein [Planctomycetaceae bacterium]
QALQADHRAQPKATIEPKNSKPPLGIKTSANSSTIDKRSSRTAKNHGSMVSQTSFQSNTRTRNGQAPCHITDIHHKHYSPNSLSLQSCKASRAGMQSTIPAKIDGHDSPPIGAHPFVTLKLRALQRRSRHFQRELRLVVASNSHLNSDGQSPRGIASRARDRSRFVD